MLDLVYLDARSSREKRNLKMQKWTRSYYESQSARYKSFHTRPITVPSMLLVLGTPGSVLSAPVNSVYCAPMRLVPSIVPDSCSLVYCGALRFAV